MTLTRDFSYDQLATIKAFFTQAEWDTIDVVSAFLDVFDIENVSSCRDAYMGRYESGAEFAQSIAEDCGEVGSNSSWIEIDWKASWDNLSYDYVECGNYGDCYIFSQNF